MGFLKAAFFVGVIAVLGVFVCRYIETKLPVRVNGHVEPGFELVQQVFRKNFEDGAEEYGNAFAAYYNNKLVVDLWGGYADKASECPWKRDTMSVFWSSTKAISALCISILIDRGAAKYDDLVVKHWPEFGKHGKRNVTIEMMLAHQAGIPCVDQEMTTEILGDLKKLCKVIEDQKPQLPPGRYHAYHTLTHGYLISCLISRIDPKKRILGQFFQEEVADKFGIDFYIGLPKELHYRVARIEQMGSTFWDLLGTPFMMYKLIGKSAVFARRSLFEQTPLVLMYPKLMNSVDVQMIGLGAAGGIGTARAQAKLYNILVNGGKQDGKTLISEATLEKAFEQITSGNEMNFGIFGVHMQYTRGGFFIGNFWDESADVLIGSPGYGMQAAFLQRNLNVSMAFLTNGITGSNRDERFLSLFSALQQCIKKMSLKKT